MSLLGDLRRTGGLFLREPERMWPTLARAAGLLRASLVLRNAQRGERVSVQGPLDVKNEGRITIASHVYFLPGMLTTHIDVRPGAELFIGEHAGFNFGVRISACERVSIGARCMFASMVTVADARGAPIVIEDDVWVAHGATISAGVTIGAGSVVSAGTTVTRDVPAQHLAIGAPARNVRLDTLSRAR